MASLLPWHSRRLVRTRSLWPPEHGKQFGKISALSHNARLTRKFLGWAIPRYDRVCKAQQVGETTRDEWHRAKIGDKSAEELGLPLPEWLLAFDAEAHAYSVIDETARDIVENGYRLPSLKAGRTAA